MAKFQVLSLKPMSGIGKQSQKPYVMLIITGIFTNDDGSVEVGELMFMQGDNRPLPTVVPGQTYIPVVSGRSRQGRLQIEVNELRPMVAASGVKPPQAA